MRADNCLLLLLNSSICSFVSSGIFSSNIFFLLFHVKCRGGEIAAETVRRQLVHLPGHNVGRYRDDALKPVILYNVPPRTGVRCTAEVYAALAKHPNIVGVKEASSDLALVSTPVFPISLDE